MKMDLLDRSVIEKISDSEVPIHYFYLPVIKYFYLRRFELVFELMGDEKYGNMLEIGYGTGILFPELAKRTKELHAAEVKDSSNLIMDALKKRNISVLFSAGSIHKLPYDNDKFECIVCISVLEHIKDLDSAMSEVRRIMKPGGKAYFSFPAKNAMLDQFFRLSGYNPDKIHPSSHGKILGKASEYFKVAEIKKLSMIVPLYFACKCVKK
ncbi:MAG: class I SAM-dependent methyltransferase [Elusimicrobiota bacterium]